MLLLKSCFGVVGFSHKLNSCAWRSVFESAVSIWSGTRQQKSEAAGSTASLSIIIMAFALIDFDLSIDHTVNKSVRIINASAPIA